MPFLWFALGYAVSAYWTHRDHVQRGIHAVEQYANYDYDKFHDVYGDES